MAIGNGRRGRAKVRLRLRSHGSWYWLSRDPLGWVGPYTSAEDAYRSASENGALWRNEEFTQ